MKGAYSWRVQKVSPVTKKKAFKAFKPVVSEDYQKVVDDFREREQRMVAKYGVKKGAI